MKKIMENDIDMQSVRDSIWISVEDSVWGSVSNSVSDPVKYSVLYSFKESAGNSVWDSIMEIGNGK